MEPVGITKACTRVVVPNNSSRMVMVHSAMVPRGGSGLAMAADAPGSAAASAFPRSRVGFIASIPLSLSGGSLSGGQSVYARAGGAGTAEAQQFPDGDVEVQQAQAAQCAPEIGTGPVIARPMEQAGQQVRKRVAIP